MTPQQYFHDIDELFGFVRNFIIHKFQIDRKIVLNKDLFYESHHAASNLVTVHYSKEVLLLLTTTTELLSSNRNPIPDFIDA